MGRVGAAYVFLAAAVVAGLGTHWLRVTSVYGQTVDPAGRVQRAAALRERGTRLAAAGDLFSAIAYFRDALSIDGADARSFEHLGRTYLALGRTRDALEALSVGLRRCAQDPGLWGAYGEALLAAGDLEGAAEALRERSRLEPDHVPTLMLRGEVAQRRGAFAEALACYRRVVDLRRGERTTGPMGTTPAATVPGSSPSAPSPNPSAAGTGEDVAARASALAAAAALLAGGTDPVRGRSCASLGPVRAALAGCPEPR
jgi:tetratricopeptide (TPR) repeat protein